ncbi:MAG: inositol monophosphatase [Gammaproteobacteria bacterium]|nr:inositol monophosphatase [Gammaproteobacteria bacterium]MDH5693512.1 inositol monophosphatase [Gammaproteobacteria bacterium]
MHPLVNIGVRAARSAGTIIVRALNQLDSLKVTEKSQNDYVTEVDKRAEAEIIKTIHRAYPNHSIMAEEGGLKKREDEYVWIIDPLDGTTNFLRGIPQFSISIAVQHKGELTAAVIYDPLKDELFTAAKGSGAQLNDRRIRVGTRKDLRGALLGTGFPYRDDQSVADYLPTLQALIPGTAGVRRIGSAALDLAYVAAGRFDGFWEYGLNSWDMAAGVLLVREAGGVATDAKGGDELFETGDVIAGNIDVHREMLSRISKCR